MWWSKKYHIPSEIWWMVTERSFNNPRRENQHYPHEETHSHFQAAELLNEWTIWPCEWVENGGVRRRRPQAAANIIMQTSRFLFSSVEAGGGLGERTDLWQLQPGEDGDPRSPLDYEWDRLGPTDGILQHCSVLL